MRTELLKKGCPSHAAFVAMHSKVGHGKHPDEIAAEVLPEYKPTGSFHAHRPLAIARPRGNHHSILTRLFDGDDRKADELIMKVKIKHSSMSSSEVANPVRRLHQRWHPTMYAFSKQMHIDVHINEDEFRELFATFTLHVEYARDPKEEPLAMKAASILRSLSRHFGSTGPETTRNMRIKRRTIGITKRTGKHLGCGT